jgi:hypothetical protein
MKLVPEGIKQKFDCTAIGICTLDNKGYLRLPAKDGKAMWYTCESYGWRWLPAEEQDELEASYQALSQPAAQPITPNPTMERF